MRFIYTVLIRLYGAAIWIATPFSKKAKAWVLGRKSWRYHMAKVLAEPASQTMWMHVASLGEFEQGRPVLEAYKNRYPDHRIVLTFFSPSGYEVRKNYGTADYVSYLPLDTPANVSDFLEIVTPDVVIFIKYEFWFNYLRTLKERGVKTYLVSGRFYAAQNFFASWGGFFRQGLTAFTHFAVQDEESHQLLKTIGFENVMVSGDTRFDRVTQIVEADGRLPMIEKFVSGAPVLVLGSSWPDEEMMAMNFIQANPQLGWKYIVAPHEIEEGRISALEEQVQKMGLSFARLSAGEQGLDEAQVLCVDHIGLLPSIYRYGRVAFVGGGFGRGIHNVLEPAAWGVPVIFGPRHEKFKEAIDLIELEGAIPVGGQEEFSKVLLSLVRDEKRASECGKRAQQYCQQRAGATEKVMNLI